MPVNPAPLIARADKALESLESDTLARIRKALEASEARLEGELSRRWRKALKDASSASSAALAEARARQLLEEISQFLEVFDQKPLLELFESHISRVVSQETDESQEMLKEFGVDAPIAQTTINVEAIRAVAQNSISRLSKHSREFAETAESEIIQGITLGKSFQQVARALRQATGVAMSRASTIVRTETVNASDEARRATYRENGINYVIRVATQDTRVCPFCAARAGNIYEESEAPAVIHPNDRCYNAPFKPEWVEAGVFDMKWYENHAKEVLSRSEKGYDPGPAPFEKAAGKQAPMPLWIPGEKMPTKWPQNAGKKTIDTGEPEDTSQKAPQTPPVSAPKPGEAPKFASVAEAENYLKAKGVKIEYGYAKNINDPNSEREKIPSEAGKLIVLQGYADAIAVIEDQGMPILKSVYDRVENKSYVWGENIQIADDSSYQVHALNRGTRSILFNTAHLDVAQMEWDYNTEAEKFMRDRGQTDPKWRFHRGLSTMRNHADIVLHELGHQIERVFPAEEMRSAYYRMKYLQEQRELAAKLGEAGPFAIDNGITSKIDVPSEFALTNEGEMWAESFVAMLRKYPFEAPTEYSRNEWYIRAENRISYIRDRYREDLGRHVEYSRNVPGNFQSIDEAREWVTKYYPHIFLDVSDSDNYMIFNGVAKAMERTGNEFPEVLARLEYVGNGAADRAGRFNVHSVRVNSYYSTSTGNGVMYASRDGKEVGINPRWSINYTEYIQMRYGTSVNANPDSYETWDGSRSWTVENQRINPADTDMTHELGHHIHNWLNSLTREYLITPEGYAGLDGVGMAGETFRRWFEAHKPTLSELSQYGMTNDEERMAEVYAGITHIPREKWSEYMKKYDALMSYYRNGQLYKGNMTLASSIRDQEEKQKALQTLADIRTKLGL